MKKILNKLYLLPILLPAKVYAAPPRLEELGVMLDSVFSLIMPLGGLAAVGMVVYGGYMWMMSQGDPGKLKQAQGTITWAVIGLVFLGIFGLVLRIVFDFIGN